MTLRNGLSLGSFAVTSRGGQKAAQINGPAAFASFFVLTSAYTFEKRRGGICRISHAVDTLASTELKAR